MFPLEMPPQPPWEGMHPLVIHFPIGLLFIAPLFMLLAALLGKYGRWFGVTALLLLVIGTAGAHVSVLTGDAAYDVLEEIDDDGWEVVEEHQEAAKNVRNLYVWLTVFYAVLLALPLLIWKLNSLKYWLPVNVVALALLLFVNLQLANAAHLGGRLVHQYGARAVLAEEEEAVDEESDEASDEDMDEAEDGDDTAAESEEPAEETSTEAEMESESEKPEAEPADVTPAEEKSTEPAPEGEATAKKEESAEAKEPPAEAAKVEPAEPEAKETPAEPSAKEPAEESAKEPPAESS